MMIVIFCVVFGFIIASLFMSTVEMAIDTTLLSLLQRLQDPRAET